VGGKDSLIQKDGDCCFTLFRVKSGFSTSLGVQPHKALSRSLGIEAKI